MKLTDDEKAMLDGKEGPVRRKAMELLVRYGEALGAELLVDTNNAGGVFGGFGPHTLRLTEEEIFFEFSLDSGDVEEIPRLKAFSCHFEQSMDLEHWELQGVSREAFEASKRSRAFAARIGFQLINTCAPYLAGNVPVMGEHCAWMESSAVVYCNSVLGARTNTEGRESSTAAMLTGKIPYWGYHLDENRQGIDLVEVEYEVESTMDWGLLGYYAGEIVQDRVPVFKGIRRKPNLAKLKHLGAASASSGGVEMYHIVGVTPEAHSLEQAFGKKKPAKSLSSARRERKKAYDMLNSSNTETHVDFVMLGCPPLFHRSGLGCVQAARGETRQGEPLDLCAERHQGAVRSQRVYGDNQAGRRRAHDGYLSMPGSRLRSRTGRAVPGRRASHRSPPTTRNTPR